MSEKASNTIEDYLGAMFILQRDGEPIVGTRLAEIIGVTPPTVTNTLKRMARDGLVILDERSGPRLSEHGFDTARSVMRRHMLTEWLLVSKLNVAWSHIHTEAHQIEHTISDEVEALMRTNLEDPKLCPHGNPLPGFEYVTKDWVRLLDIPAGEQVIVRRVHEMAEDNAELLAFLEANMIMPGKPVTVREVLPFNETLAVSNERGQNVTLGFKTARYLYVERPAAGS